MRFNRKGFTLVELLAVVVILGIIMMVSIPAVSKWINRSKDSSKDAQEKTLLLAAQSYAQGNTKVLPKAIGESSLIKATDLKKSNYLKEDLKDSEKKDCMKDSVVRIYKYDKNGYSYTAYLYCEGDTVPEEILGVEPIIGITFTGDYLKEDTLQDVSKAGFRVSIEGGKKDGKNLGIDGYTYSISVKYAGTGEVVEIFNSGSLNAGGKEKLLIEKSLRDYTKENSLSEFMITVEAYNRDGGYKKVTTNSKYNDSTPPECGDIIGEAGENEWFSSPHTSTISVKCVDEANGSGCIKEVFTKSWNTEIEEDYIEIKDNAGNTNTCKVKIHHDWTSPVLTITAHQNLLDGGKGTQVGSITADKNNPDVTLSSYTGEYEDDHWLNYEYFPLGVYYEITVTDNVHIHTGQWYYNNSNIFDFNASNLNNMNIGSSKSFSVNDNQTYVTLTAEGLRRGRYEVTDKAGNKTIVRIEANMDRTNPACSTSKTNNVANGGVDVSITCSDNESGCSSSNILSYTGQTASTSYSVSDNANNTGSCSVTLTSKLQKRTRTCKTHDSCVDSSCPCAAYNRVCATNYNSVCENGRVPSSNNSRSCRGDASSHYQSNGDFLYCRQCCTLKNGTCKRHEPCVNKNCDCIKWNSWGSWSDVSSCKASTTKTTDTQCRTVYY